MRYASVGHFVVYMHPEADVANSLVPVPIMDLQVEKIGTDNVTLSFTAPGDDLDSGTGKFNFHTQINNCLVWCKS